MGILKSILSICLTTVIYILGGFDVALQSLLIANVLDYITGIASGYVNSELSSRAGLRGIIKKVCMFCLVALGVLIDNITGANGVIRSGVIYYLVANEGLSIVENLGQMNILVPDFLKSKLEQISLKEDDKNEIK